jgi:hypothetical protein
VPERALDSRFSDTNDGKNPMVVGMVPTSRKRLIAIDLNVRTSNLVGFQRHDARGDTHETRGTHVNRVMALMELGSDALNARNENNVEENDIDLKKRHHNRGERELSTEMQREDDTESASHVRHEAGVVAP